tara:strand:+ start:2321 stop:2650 length:330 start_codon:yes stop_codon:yes gene_type:complete
MNLPIEIIDHIFDFIDAKNIIYLIDGINQETDEIYNLEYFTSGSIGRAAYSLFLKKREIIKQYTDCLIIYHKFCQISIKYWIIYHADCMHESFINEDKELLNLIRFNKL